MSRILQSRYHVRTISSGKISSKGYLDPEDTLSMIPDEEAYKYEIIEIKPTVGKVVDMEPMLRQRAKDSYEYEMRQARTQAYGAASSAARKGRDAHNAQVIVSGEGRMILQKGMSLRTIREDTYEKYGASRWYSDVWTIEAINRDGIKFRQNKAMWKYNPDGQKIEKILQGRQKPETRLILPTRVEDL